MTGLHVLFLAVVLLPLFAAQWRVSLMGLALQGVLLWVASGAALGDPWDLAWALDFLDYLALRGVLAPVLLFVALRRPGVPARNDVIPATLIAWMAVVGLVLLAFHFAAQMDPTALPDGQVAVASASLLIGLFVLSTQRSVFSQIVGVIRIENAVALFALAGPGHEAIGIHALHVVATGGAVALFVFYLRTLALHPDTDEVAP